MLNMKNLKNTDYFILTDKEADQIQSLQDQMNAPQPVVPSGCGPMVQIKDAADRAFLQAALAA